MNDIFQNYFYLTSALKTGYQIKLDTKTLKCSSTSKQCGGACVPKSKRCKSTTLRQNFNINFVLSREESKIRDLPKERAVCINPRTGIVEFDTGNRGTINSIYITPEERQKVKGKIFTHNHPNMGYPSNDPRAAGVSFSDADVSFACYNEVAEVRAVTTNYNHSLKPPQQGWNRNFYDLKVKPAHEFYKKQVYNELVALILDNKITPESAEIQYHHEVMNRVAATTGLKYKRERIK